MGKFLTEFKEFAMKGNVVDMAVGVIIGGAFGKIVSSLVNDVIMPLVTLVTGGVNFTDKKIILRHMTDGNGDVITQQVADQLTAAGQTVNPEVYLTWGVFVQSIVDFLIIAFCIFVAIRFMNKLKKSTKEEEAAPAEPTKEEALLTEIRDLLKAQADNKK
ncbi:MAG: large-conductance mechanosensitive channel protein MscL [Muribaculaceae bacterium]|jgi:large conductance mechanosensitive channel|nr:large-conductance mechanosensitive channel protein MscL [Muribaculaceae bacterium]